MTDKLKQLFTSSEIEGIINTTIKDRSHPVKRLLQPRGLQLNTIPIIWLLLRQYNCMAGILFLRKSPRPRFGRDELVILNTDIAIRYIVEHHRNWLMSLKPRLLNVDDYSSSSGTLGEIRALGYLLQTGISVDPIGKAGSDFWLSEGKEKAFVEVHSRQLNSDERETLQNFHNEILRNIDSNSQANQRVSVVEYGTVPLGRPKIGENITENAISKLASIKGKEHQMSSDETSILWLDFQDEIWNLLDTINRVLPLTTHNNAFYSGELWYAFYGWIDAPIYEAFRWDMVNDVVKMRHQGRFRQETKLDAVVVSFSRDTIILENPYSRKPIKPWLWKRLVFLPRFNFEMSYTNWPAVNLRQRIELEQEKLIALSSIAL